jgi:radical SAM protein with 4Fe4S-binding SPASM domain
MDTRRATRMTFFHDIHNKNLLEECPVGIDSHEWSIFRDNYKRAAQFEELENPPQLDIELNGGCNMKCPFCLHGYGKKRPNTLMAIERYKKLIDEAVAFGVRGLKLNYINEPMLRTDLEECIAYAKSAGILNVYMVTNGTLLNKKRQDSMLNSGITKIFISVDAVTAKTYNRQRLSGKFDLVVKNILDFVEERNRRKLKYPLVRVSFLRNKLNIDEEEAFQNFWEDKVDMIAFQKMNDLPDLNSGLIIKNNENETEVISCNFPFKQMVVDHEGDILPCCKMGGKKLALGNINNMTLKQAWFSNQMKALQRLHKENRWQENSVCKRCITGNGG